MTRKSSSEYSISLKESQKDSFYEKSMRSGNQAWVVSRKRTILHIFIVIASALLFSASFPPLNYSFIAWVAILPLILIVRKRTILQAIGFGYLWGYCWALSTFFWLREIEFILPFVGAFYFAIFPMLWTMMIPVFQHSILSKKNKSSSTNPLAGNNKWYWIKEILFVAVLASFWTILEWVRGWFFSGFPWNLAGVSQWKNLPVIQICEYSGVYGVSFLILFFNSSLIFVFDGIKRSITTGKYSRPIPFLFAIVLLMGSLLLGFQSMIKYNVVDNKNNKENVTFQAAVIQGNIPQCRNPQPGEADFALEQYLKLTQLAMFLKPDIVIWPETAIPVPYFSGHSFGSKYRFELLKLQKEGGVPLLFGSIDFGQNLDKNVKPEEIPVYNAALLLNKDSQIIDRYFKQHLVPFGEYTPLGDYYPVIKKYLGMGRDLSPGKRYTIFNLKDGVRAGTQICFEDIFPYISRGFVQRGANLLIVLSNDAWYPNSSEAEQHMANAIFRAIENRCPVIRAGNNNCSCVILPNGVIADSVSIKEDEFGNMILAPEASSRGYAEFKLHIKRNPKLTFYTKYGDLFLLFCGVLTIFAFINALWGWREKKERSIARFAK